MWMLATRAAATDTQNGSRRHNACARGNMRWGCLRMPRGNAHRQRLPLPRNNVCRTARNVAAGT